LKKKKKKNGFLAFPLILELEDYFYHFYQYVSCYVELENRLLARFDAASQRRELSTMAECAKILSQVIIFVRPDR
jgi:hypothetical protein